MYYWREECVSNLPKKQSALDIDCSSRQSAAIEWEVTYYIMTAHAITLTQPWL